MVAAIGAGVSAATAIAGAAAGSQKSGGSSSQASSAPWAPQQPYILGGIQQAQTNLNNASNIAMPTSFVAGENRMQSGADNALYNQGMGAQNSYAPWQSFGQNAAGMTPAYLNNAAGIASGGIGAQSGDTQVLSNYARTGQMPGAPSIDPRLAQGVTQAGLSGLGSLGQGASLASQAGQAALNPNGTIAAAQAGGAALSSNPGLDGAIDAANRDVNRSLTENTLPQIRAGAMASGNANSSREGALEAIATRGASDQMADTAAQMRLGAYTQGANIGATGYNQGLNSALSAGSVLNSNGGLAGNLLTNEQAQQQNQNQFGTSSMLGAANNAASQNLAYQNAFTAAQLAGNSQLGTGVGMGLNAIGQAQSGLYTGLNQAYQAGSNEQSGMQAGINDNLANYRMQTQGQSDLLDRYWKQAGAGLGSSSTSTTTPNNGGLGGAISGAVGGGMAGWGLYKNLTGSNGLNDQFANTGGFGGPGVSSLDGTGLGAVQSPTAGFWGG